MLKSEHRGERDGVLGMGSLGDRDGGLKIGSNTKGNCATIGKGGVPFDGCGGTVLILLWGEFGWVAFGDAPLK